MGLSFLIIRDIVFLNYELSAWKVFLNESAARVKDSYILWFLVLNFSSIYTMRAKFSFMKKAIVSASVLHRDIFFFLNSLQTPIYLPHVLF